MNNTRMKKLIKWSGLLSLIIGLLALLAMLIQGPGYRAGWWGLMFSFRTVFPVLPIAGVVAVLFGMIGVIGSKFFAEKFSMIGIVGIITGIAAAFVPISFQHTVKSVPMIHDITTDTTNPPEFIYVAPLRAKAANPVSYDPEIAALQLEAYPDIKTIEISAKPADVFAAALAVVDKLDWSLVRADDIAYRIEATETSAWFGFKDDVVIRISKGNDAEKTIIDVRSKSRIGKSDLGINAKRIRAFRQALLGQF